MENEILATNLLWENTCILIVYAPRSNEFWLAPIPMLGEEIFLLDPTHSYPRRTNTVEGGVTHVYVLADFGQTRILAPRIASFYFLILKILTRHIYRVS